MTKREEQRAAKQKALPEVQALVKKHGRRAVQACLNQMKDYERSVEELRQKKQEVDSMERRLRSKLK